MNVCWRCPTVHEKTAFNELHKTLKKNIELIPAHGHGLLNFFQLKMNLAPTDHHHHHHHHHRLTHRHHHVKRIFSYIFKLLLIFKNAHHKRNEKFKAKSAHSDFFYFMLSFRSSIRSGWVSERERERESFLVKKAHRVKLIN
jgi:hypothetical protein